MNTCKRAVLTIATGKPIYIQMAINLARSFKWWHQQSDIRFVLATDQKELLPPDLKDIDVVELKPRQYGAGFSPKLYLDQITPAEQTLFIDSDCLCFGSLDSVFDRFEGKAVSVIGDVISQGEFFCNVASVCQQFQVSSLPRFVGGVYYFKKGDVSERVFDFARKLEAKYDEIGLVRLRGYPNEEPLIAIAMAVHHQTPLEDDGSIKAERMSYHFKMKADVFQGIAELNNSISAEFPTWVHLTRAQPLIVHFNGSYIGLDPYPREALKLKVVANGWPVWLASQYAWITCSLPANVIRSTKDVFRPLYRSFLGTRRVASSLR